MKKHRTWLSLILILVLLLSGCNNSVQDAAENIEVSFDENADVQESLPQTETVVAKELAEVNASMEETVLIDDENVSMIVTEYDPKGDLGPTFTLLLENKTDSNLYFTISDVSVNDVMADPLWGENVPVGESKYSKLYWFPKSLLAVGINYIAEVEGTVWIYDADDHSSEDTYEDVVSWSVENSGTNLPPVEEAVFSGGIEDIEIFDTEDISAIIKDYSWQGEWGPSLNIYLDNKTESTVLFFMTSVYINDIELDPYWSSNVSAGKVDYSFCNWWQEDLEEKQIDEIKTLTFTFGAIDYETWEHLEEVTMTVSLEGTGEILEQNTL